MKYIKNKLVKNVRFDCFDADKNLVLSFYDVNDPSKSDDLALPSMNARIAADSIGSVSFMSVHFIN